MKYFSRQFCFRNKYWNAKVMSVDKSTFVFAWFGKYSDDDDEGNWKYIY